MDGAARSRARIGNREPDVDPASGQPRAEWARRSPSFGDGPAGGPPRADRGRGGRARADARSCHWIQPPSASGPPSRGASTVRGGPPPPPRPKLPPARRPPAALFTYV